MSMRSSPNPSCRISRRSTMANASSSRGFSTTSGRPSTLCCRRTGVVRRFSFHRTSKTCCLTKACHSRGSHRKTCLQGFSRPTPRETAGGYSGRTGSRLQRRVAQNSLESDDSELREYTRFAAEAADALINGPPSASQALSANLLDTILRRSFSKDSREAVTDQANRPNIDDYPLRVAIVIGGIWGSHAEYRPYRGDTIPYRYSRHASAHGVSRRQYSRVNAVIALMHVVALLKVMDVDLR